MADYPMCCGRAARKRSKTSAYQDAPTTKIDPIHHVIEGARSFAQQKGLADPHEGIDYHRVMTHQKLITDLGHAYDKLPEHDPSAVSHFEAMKNEVGQQYHHMTHNMGLHVQVMDHDPYKDVHELRDDVQNNHRIKVLGTHATGGHPFFSNDENDQFRAVHDVFGHLGTGRGFDRHGEEAAYQAHSRMFSDHARGAMASETRGQNGSLITNGHFGPQRIAVLPRHLWTPGLARNASHEDMRPFNQSAEYIDSMTMPDRVAVLVSDSPFKITAHVSGNQVDILHCPFCFTGTSRYMTREGIKSFADTVGTTQWVLTADENQRTSGRWVEAHIHEFGEQPVLAVTVQRNKIKQVIHATPEHRWLVKENIKRRAGNQRVDRTGKPRNWKSPVCARGHEFLPETTRIRSNGSRDCKLCAKEAKTLNGISRSTDREVLTQDLKKGHRLSYLIEDVETSGILMLKPSEDGIRHGIIFGDGTGALDGRFASIVLWGEKDKQLLKYFPAVDAKPRMTPNGVHGIYLGGAKNKLRASMKLIPSLDESHEYLLGWLAGYFAADGSVGSQGQAVLSSANIGHLEYVKTVANKLGIVTGEIHSRLRKGYGKEPSLLHRVEFTANVPSSMFLVEEHRDRFLFRDYSYSRLGWTVVSVEETDRVETVYCAVVPETHSFALEGNIWVKNCGSGAVIGRSDGTVECGFCTSVFTVQTQPQYSGMPQSVDGQPYQWPGQPDAAGIAGPDMPEGTNLNPNTNGEMDPGMDPNAAGAAPPFQSSDPADGGDEGDDEDGEDDDGKPAFLKGKGDSKSDKKSDKKKGDNPFAKKKSYVTASGGILDEADYLAHLAISFAEDKPRVASLVKAARRG